MSHNDLICEVCNDASMQLKCSFCRKGLCYACAHFELVGSGCGTIYPLYYCPSCAYDDSINPNAGFKDRRRK
jgi:hypothetical protein